jgi:hypothetical protein
MVTENRSVGGSIPPPGTISLVRCPAPLTMGRATQRQESNLHRPDHDCVEIEDSIRLSYAADAPNRIDESAPAELTPISKNTEIDVNSAYDERLCCPNSMSSAADDLPLANLSSSFSICSGFKRLTASISILFHCSSFSWLG